MSMPGTTGSLRGSEKSFGLKPGLELRVCKPSDAGASLNQFFKMEIPANVWWLEMLGNQGWKRTARPDDTS
jgi:hypothetical protein